MKKFFLQERDLEIVKAVNRYRYLNTAQINKLLFSENTTMQSARRRLRYLSGDNYLGRLDLPIGQTKNETVFFLEKEGAKLLAFQNEEVYFYPKASHVKPMYLAHALDISEFRLNLELALQNHPLVRFKNFIADFELKADFHSFKGRWRYQLYNQMLHKTKHKIYAVYPDATFILQGKGQYEEYQELFFVEIDRGTSSLQVILEKAVGYLLFFEDGYFQKKFSGFQEFIVLLQTTSPQRAENIRDKIKTEPGGEFFWITDVSKVNEKTILSNIWQNNDLVLQYLVKN